MDLVQQAKRIVYDYNLNPNDYTNSEAEKIAVIALQLGLPFRPETKKLQKFFFDLADSATFGAIPNSMRPKSRGEDLYGETRSERLSSGAGNLLGLAIPLTAGAKVGSKLLPRKAMTDASKFRTTLRRAAEGATRGAGGLAAINLAEDPLGAPERAMTGALYGGLLGPFIRANLTRNTIAESAQRATPRNIDYLPRLV